MSLCSLPVSAAPKQCWSRSYLPISPLCSLSHHNTSQAKKVSCRELGAFAQRFLSRKEWTKGSKPAMCEYRSSTHQEALVTQIGCNKSHQRSSVKILTEQEQRLQDCLASLRVSRLLWRSVGSSTPLVPSGSITRAPSGSPDWLSSVLPFDSSLTPLC